MQGLRGSRVLPGSYQEESGEASPGPPMDQQLPKRGLKQWRCNDLLSEILEGSCEESTHVQAYL